MLYICPRLNQKFYNFILTLWDRQVKWSLKIWISCIWICVFVFNQIFDFKQNSIFNSFKKLLINFLLLDPFFDVSDRVLILFNDPINIRGVKRSVGSHFNTPIDRNYTWLSIIWGWRFSGKHGNKLHIFHMPLRLCVLISFVNLIIRSIMTWLDLWLWSRLFIGSKACYRSLLNV